MSKKITLLFVVFLVISVGMNAQEENKRESKTPGLRGSLSVHANIDPYMVYDFNSLGSYVTGIGSFKDVGMSIPSMGIGLDGGFTGRWITLNLNGRVNFGTKFVEGVIPQQNIDIMLFADFGIRLKLWVIELEASGGFGVDFPNMSMSSNSSSNNDDRPILSYCEETHMIAPIAATLWFGGARRARHRVGLAVEYVFRVGKFKSLPSSPIDAIGDITNQVVHSPATVNVGLKYQF